MQLYEALIRENQIDIFGHVNNATYLEFFEAARWDILEAKGFGFEKIKSLGQGPVILEAHLKFIKEVKARDLITIKTEPMQFKGKIGEMKQYMYKPNQELAAELRLVFGLFDLRARQLILPTPEWLEALTT